MEDDLEEILAEHGYNIHLKHEQTECLLHLNEGSNVFAQLPTRFGKSMVYTLFPLFKERVCLCYYFHYDALDHNAKGMVEIEWVQCETQRCGKWVHAYWLKLVDE